MCSSNTPWIRHGGAFGGQGTKTMQSVLKDIVEDGESYHQVTESYVYLEIENYRTITTKRSVQSTYRDYKLVDVFDGAYLTGSEEDRSSMSLKNYYLFDANAAQDKQHGFHAYLENFLGWHLPSINNAQGNEAKLYIQTVFPAFFIEQKSGWSDFLATIPYFGLRSVESKVAEFLLNMDIIENDIKKQELKQAKQQLQHKWDTLKIRLKELANSGNCILRGYPEKPEKIEDFNLIRFTINHQNRVLSIDEYLKLLGEEYNALENKAIPKVQDRSNDFEKKLLELEETISDGSILYGKLTQETSQDIEKVRYLKSQLEDTKKDVESYKAEIKLQKLGSTLDLSVSLDSCPTCHQHINGSLLPQNINQRVMTADENLDFLKAQQKMIEIYIDTAQQNIDRNTTNIAVLSTTLRNQRSELRGIKKTLMSDDRLPSEADIERKIISRQRLDFYVKFSKKFDSLKDEIVFLVDEFTSILNDEARLPKAMLSHLDARKHSDMESYFRLYLNKFNYSSKDPNSIKISFDKYQPSVEGLALRKELDSRNKKSYDIRYDSSASDFVRSIWAYTCTLFKVSDLYNGNHPGLIVMDEPEQHSMSDQSLRNLLIELASFKNCQSIVAASFHNEESVFRSATSGLNCHIIKLGYKAIVPFER
ncbi:hypothetical protein [Spirosoma rhododendri]|uniref:Uncharacterized protein n=1 Tax=Spirosoma rhododendri TaxID=2728024 RepID=A0A7L5DIQ8_9BACT|nr:hypothetical protein [Spirosoma rhododendri]QJD76973.1 hypothetical protein HH216_15070 [Spirosoma rhododendri]